MVVMHILTPNRPNGNIKRQDACQSKPSELYSIITRIALLEFTNWSIQEARSSSTYQY